MRNNKAIVLFVENNSTKVDDTPKLNLLTIPDLEYDLDRTGKLIENRKQAYFFIESLMDAVEYLRYLFVKQPNKLNPRDKYQMFPACIHALKVVRRTYKKWGKSLNKHEKERITYFLESEGGFFNNYSYKKLKDKQLDYVTPSEILETNAKINAWNIVSGDWECHREKEYKAMQHSLCAILEDFLPLIKPRVNKPTFGLWKERIVQRKELKKSHILELPMFIRKKLFEDINITPLDNGTLAYEAPNFQEFLSVLSPVVTTKESIEIQRIILATSGDLGLSQRVADQQYMDSLNILEDNHIIGNSLVVPDDDLLEINGNNSMPLLN